MSAETAVSKRIREVLESIGIPVIRVQSGQFRVGPHVIHMAPAGTPDLVTPYGWLEVKDEGNESPEQIEFRKTWTRMGARVATVRSVSEAVRVVSKWRREQELINESR